MDAQPSAVSPKPCMKITAAVADSRDGTVRPMPPPYIVEDIVMVLVVVVLVVVEKGALEDGEIDGRDVIEVEV